MVAGRCTSGHQPRTVWGWAKIARESKKGHGNQYSSNTHCNSNRKGGAVRVRPSKRGRPHHNQHTFEKGEHAVHIMTTLRDGALQLKVLIVYCSMMMKGVQGSTQKFRARRKRGLAVPWISWWRCTIPCSGIGTTRRWRTVTCWRVLAVAQHCG